MPWLNWATDFGGGTSNQGVTSASSQTALKAAFQQAKDAGVTNIRWWVFEGDPWQIHRDGSNNPTGLDPAVYPDFDAAVALAETLRPLPRLRAVLGAVSASPQAG